MLAGRAIIRATMSLPSGTRLGPYQIVELLGAGGMGEVFRARDTRLQRDVALKILPELVAGDGERFARFEREARALAALAHPNILGIHDFGTEGGVTFTVTELLEGATLRERLAGGGLPPRLRGPLSAGAEARKSDLRRG